MAVDEIIAIVGLKSGKITGFVERLSRKDFHLLIVPDTRDHREGLVEQVKQLEPKAEVEVLDCPREGCWEADVIAFINPHDFGDEILNRIREVAVQKVVMAVFEGVSSFIAGERYNALKISLPHSKIVKLVVLPKEEKVSLQGEDHEAVQKVAKLLEKSPYTIV